VIVLEVSLSSPSPVEIQISNHFKHVVAAYRFFWFNILSRSGWLARSLISLWGGDYSLCKVLENNYLL
jgi:hypothetical protein